MTKRGRNDKQKVWICFTAEGLPCLAVNPFIEGWHVCRWHKRLKAGGEQVLTGVTEADSPKEKCLWDSTTADQFYIPNLLSRTSAIL